MIWMFRLIGVFIIFRCFVYLTSINFERRRLVLDNAKEQRKYFAWVKRMEGIRNGQYELIQTGEGEVAKMTAYEFEYYLFKHGTRRYPLACERIAGGRFAEFMERTKVKEKKQEERNALYVYEREGESVEISRRPENKNEINFEIKKAS